MIPASGDVLQRPRCGDERPFVKPPLLIVTGTAGAGKSTLCARLAGTIPGAAAAGNAGTNAWLDARTTVWIEFNAALVAATRAIPAATVVDAGRSVEEVEHDVGHWIKTRLAGEPTR